ncbi:hypothetical protein [Burkholderia stagnalis]
MRLSIGCDLANRQVAACGNGRIVADHQNYGDDYINCRNDLIVFMGVGRIDFSEIISRIRSAIITDAMQPRMGEYGCVRGRFFDPLFIPWKISCKCKALQYPIPDCAFRLRCVSLFGRIFIKLHGFKTTKRRTIQLAEIARRTSNDSTDG